MKIRHPLLIKTIGFLGALAIRLWVGTLRYRSLGSEREPRNYERCIYAFWHETLLLPAYCYGGTWSCVMISQHADGEMITQVCRHLRLQTVRGSTTRGGVAALRQMARIARRNHLVITPDGPRGPRRELQMGLIYLAAMTGLPIVPVGFGYDRPWRLRSWDRFAVPRPWSNAVGILGDPIHVPKDLPRNECEDMRKRVETLLRQLTAQAEQLAEGGKAGGTKPQARQAA